MTNRLLVTTRVIGRGRDSGIEVEASGAQVWEFRDRKVVRATMFQSRDEAVAELRARPMSPERRGTGSSRRGSTSSATAGPEAGTPERCSTRPFAAAPT